eukprot:1160996-Pelagomonas_calceolata.AAC.4
MVHCQVVICTYDGGLSDGLVIFSDGVLPGFEVQGDMQERRENKRLRKPGPAACIKEEIGPAACIKEEIPDRHASMEPYTI